MNRSVAELNIRIDELKIAAANTEMDAIRTTIEVMQSTLPENLQTEFCVRLATVMKFSEETRVNQDYFEADEEENEDDDE